MKSAFFGKHYGPPIDWWNSARAAQMRAEGYRTIGENAYRDLTAAGLEPCDFEATDPGPIEQEESLV